MAEVNPLAHVQPSTDLMLNLGGRDVPFVELGTEELGLLQERHPVMKPLFAGKAIGASINSAPVRAAFAHLIAMAVGLAVDATKQQMLAIEKSAGMLKPLELETQGMKVLIKSFPGGEDAMKDFVESQGTTGKAKAPTKRSTTTRRSTPSNRS